MSYPSATVINHSLHKRFSKLCNFFRKTSNIHKRRMNKLRLPAVHFIRKSWSKSFNNGIVYNKVGFKCICTTLLRQYTEFFYKLFTRATETGRSMGARNSRNILPVNVPQSHGGKNYVFWQQTFKVVRILLSGTWFLPLDYGFCWSHEHSHSRKTQLQRNSYHS